ncbi:MAG: hypothetical protein AAF184_16150 [Pseudomonadota bacterium]
MKNSNRRMQRILIAALAGMLLGPSAFAQEQEAAASETPAAQEAPGPAVDTSPTPTRAARRRGRQDIELQTTSVSGNRELPRVMVVVPWKSAAPAELGGRPIVSLVEEALAPVDPEVFRRELEYYGLLHGGPTDDAAQLAKTATNLTEE